MNGLKEYASGMAYNILFAVSAVALLILIFVVPTTLSHLSETAIAPLEPPTPSGLVIELYKISSLFWMIFIVYIPISIVVDHLILIHRNIEFEDPRRWMGIIQSQGIFCIAHRRPKDAK